MVNTREDVLKKLSEASEKKRAALAKQLMEEAGGSIGSRLNLGGFLIDVGNDLAEPEVVKVGAEGLRLLLSDASGLADDDSHVIRYNLSNAHAALHRQLTKQGRTAEAGEENQRCKELLQWLLLRGHEVSPDLRIMVLTNYANALSHEGRAVEAIDYFLEAVRLKPDHGLALGNCAGDLRWVAASATSGRVENLDDAWRLSTEALEHEDVIRRYAGSGAVEHLRATHGELRKLIEGHFKDGTTGLERYRRHRLEEHGEPRAQGQVAKAHRDRLILTLRQMPSPSEFECVDDLVLESVSTGIGEDGEDFIKKLAHYFNSMKEDFATGRLLYYFATEQEEEIADLSANVHYLDALDYAHFGLDSGLLKACLRLATDCLDKVGGFLNEYFALGNRPEDVVFNNVWFDRLRAGKQTNPILDAEMATNWWLRALREIQRDWYREVFPGPVRSTRNLATHGKFVLYLEGDGWSAYRLESLVKFLLRQVKAAITDLVCAVETKERKKLKGKKTLTQALLVGPGLADEWNV